MQRARDKLGGTGRGQGGSWMANGEREREKRERAMTKSLEVEFWKKSWGKSESTLGQRSSTLR